MSKTLFLFECVPEESFFFVLEGDHSGFDGIYINAIQRGADLDADELNDLVYDESGRYHKHIEKLEQPTKDWDFFVRCGIMM